MTAKIFFIFTSIFFVGYCHAQMPSYKTSIDKSSIIIGEPFHLKLEVNIPHNTFTLQSLSIPDSIPHFEVLGNGKLDSVNGDASTLFIQELNITSFDSGSFVLPQFKLNFISIDKGRVFSGYTDTFPINVSYTPLDSIKPFHDIHTVIDVKDKWALWMWLALIDCFLLLLLIILYLRKILTRKKKIVLFDSKLSPYAEASQSMNELQSKRLLEEGKILEFHTLLVNIFKRFISRKTSNDISNHTSNEVLIMLDQTGHSKENVGIIANTLRMADAVKFAKFLPVKAESELSLFQTKAVIDSIHNLSNQLEK